MSCQVAPSSRETWSRPSSDPAQISSAVNGDSAMEKTTLKISTPVTSALMGPPDWTWCSGLSVVRSGLMVSQFTPSSRDRFTCWDPW